MTEYNSCFVTIIYPGWGKKLQQKANDTTQIKIRGSKHENKSYKSCVSIKMDCTKQCTRRISMSRIQDYEIFTKLHSASFKTGTENMFPIGKFTTIGLQQHQYLMFKLHSSAHGLFTFLNKVQRFIVYTHLNNKRQHASQLNQPNFPNPQFWSDSLKSGPKIYFVRQYFQTKEKL